jgi:site-specific DNA-cytosine methylase
MGSQSESVHTEETEVSEERQPTRGKPPGRGSSGRARGRAKGRGKAKGKPKTQQQKDSASEETSVSPESKRIRLAKATWDPSPAPDDPLTSDSDFDGPQVSSSNAQTLPATSSLFDYTKFLTNKVLTPEELQAAAANDGWYFAEFGAGMGTGTMCAESLRVAFQAKGLELEGNGQFYTEMVPWKRDVVTRTHKSLRYKPAGPGFVFAETADLSQAVPKTPDGKVVVHPLKCSMALFAIECDDISSLSVTPRSVLDPTGRSGTSFLQFKSYLESVKFEDRPKVLMIECVENLGKKRAALAGEKGTKVVTESLHEFGYVGSWQVLNAKHFFLPQSRPRVYGIFLKQKGFGAKGVAEQQHNVNRIWSLVARCQTKPATEPLKDLLARCSEPSQATVAKPKASTGTRWIKRHEGFKLKHQLSEQDLAATDIQSFEEAAMAIGLTTREINASACSLARSKKKGKLTNWQSLTLVGNLGDSVDRLVFKPIAPCITPTQKYLWLINGKPELKLQPAVYFTLQGLGPVEQEWFQLQELPLAKAQDLAGNAFAANVCCAVMLAILVNTNLLVGCS